MGCNMGVPSPGCRPPELAPRPWHGGRRFEVAARIMLSMGQRGAARHRGCRPPRWRAATHQLLIAGHDRLDHGGRIEARAHDGQEQLPLRAEPYRSASPASGPAEDRLRPRLAITPRIEVRSAPPVADPVRGELLSGGVLDGQRTTWWWFRANASPGMDPPMRASWPPIRSPHARPPNSAGNEFYVRNSNAGPGLQGATQPGRSPANGVHRHRRMKYRASSTHHAGETSPMRPNTC